MKLLAASLWVFAWAMAVTAAWLVADDNTRVYATVWAGIAFLVSSALAVGYVVLSQPSRGPDGRRHYRAEWWWLLLHVGLFMVVFGQAFVLRLIVPWSALPTAEQILAQRVQASVYVTAFFMQGFLLALWARQQLRTRRDRMEK